MWSADGQFVKILLEGTSSKFQVYFKKMFVCLLYEEHLAKPGLGSEYFLRLQSYSFGYLGPHAKLQNRSLPPSGLFLVSEDEDEDEQDYTIIKASLATAEVSAGGCG